MLLVFVLLVALLAWFYSLGGPQPVEPVEEAVSSSPEEANGG
jgi:hypothetical protein